MPAEKASAILDSCFAWLKKHTPFKVQRKGVALLSGKVRPRRPYLGRSVRGYLGRSVRGYLGRCVRGYPGRSVRGY